MGESGLGVSFFLWFILIAEITLSEEMVQYQEKYHKVFASSNLCVVQPILWWSAVHITPLPRSSKTLIKYLPVRMSWIGKMNYVKLLKV